MRAGGITAIVPVWNRKELIAPVLATLAAQTTAPETIIVVDNGSTDGAAEAAEALGARVIRMGANRGFAAAVNTGILEADSEWVAVVNNDVTLAPDYLERLLSAASAEGVWFATGKIYSAASPGTLDGTFDVLSRGACAWRAGNGEPDSEAWSVPQAIYSAPWTAVLFRSDLFRRVGLLDVRLESYLEDVEFGVRCALEGCAGRYVPTAHAWHQGSATLGRWHPATVRRISRNQVWLAALHFPRRYWWPLLVGQGLWGLLAFRHGTGWAWLRGKWEGVRGIRRMSSTYSPSRSIVLASWLLRNERWLRRAPGTYWKLYSLLTRAGQSDS